MSLDQKPPRQLDPATVRASRLINLLVLPGLGSWLIGRRMVGFFQAVLALTGFALTGFWFTMFMVTWIRNLQFPSDGGQYLLLGSAGVILFIAGWLWALATSLRILRQVRGSDL